MIIFQFLSIGLERSVCAYFFLTLTWVKGVTNKHNVELRINRHIDVWKQILRVESRPSLAKKQFLRVFVTMHWSSSPSKPS